jgi:hypothetical protein
MAEITNALQIMSTLSMTGLIWFVQLVHYPLFKFVETRRFAEFERVHQRRTSIVVAPLMIIEGVTAILWLWVRPDRVPTMAAVAGVALIIVIWLSTLLLQMPAHQRLAHGFNAAIHHRLVLSNWLRTISWTARTLLVWWMA